LSYLPPDLGLHDHWNFIVTLVPAKWGTAKEKEVVSENLTVMSSDPSVVSVDMPSNRYPYLYPSLVAKKLGSVRITVTAHNGVSSSFRVRVRDLTGVIDPKPVSSPDRNAEIAALVAAHGPKISALASYALTGGVRGFDARLGEDGEVEVTWGDMDGVPGWVESYVRDILMTGSIYPTEVYLHGGIGFAIKMWLSDETTMTLSYAIYNIGVPGGDPRKTHWKIWFEYYGPLF
jgi:hypothetical protein